jgi:nucleotide-binding universal stress UspA family protein
MKRYKRILVCVDCLQRDRHVVEYVGGRSLLAESAEIHFLHVAEPKAAADTAGPADQPPGITTESLQSMATECFKGHGGENLVFQVTTGTPLLEVLRYAHDKDIDVIAMGRSFGRRSEMDDEALLPRRITGKSTCSVIVLPEHYELQAREIIVPVRYSECSVNALEVACGIASVTSATVTALNVFHVGAGYSKAGKSLEEHLALLDAAAHRECDRILSETDTHGVNVSCRCEPDLHGKPAPVILEVVGDGLGKAVIIGARGRSGAAGVLLGSVTEQLIRSCPTPVLAVKKKGECIGILRALLAIAGQE